MKQEVIQISDCNRCPHRTSWTGEYPSDYCTLMGGWPVGMLPQHTTSSREPIPPPSRCPLRKKDHVVKINRRYTLTGG